MLFGRTRRPLSAALALVLLALTFLPRASAHAARSGPGSLPAAPAADDSRLFTVTVASAYGRSVPEHAAEALFSVFEGDSFPVASLSGDGLWVEIIYSDDLAGWVPGAYGVITTGERLDPGLRGLAGDASLLPRGVPEVPEGAVSLVSRFAAEVYRRGLAAGNDPRVFAKIGDCNSENGRFLVMFDQPGRYRLGERYAFLQSTIDHYAGSFSRTSVAALSGFSPASVMDPTWASPANCQPGEGPLECEYRLMRPSTAIIALGTHYGPNYRQYEADMRVVIETSIRLGVLPILATKADNIEGSGQINDITRRLAAEYQLPLWDFWAAVQPLPGHGLASDGIHFTYSRPLFDDAWSMQHGWPWRNLTALLALDQVRRLAPAPSPSPHPLYD
jgi:hypothetical protein